MLNCWAESLNECKGRQSEEHYVSRAIVGDAEVVISGLPFCGGGPRKIPGERLTRNMLCEHHNSTLSPLDSAAGHAFQVFMALRKRGRMRAMGAKKRGGIDTY